MIEPDLPKGYKRLVVEGWITDEPGPYFVKLTKTKEYSFTYSDTASFERRAEVVIKDDVGNYEILKEIIPGTYATDSTGIKGEIGRKYTLIIKTNEGKVYESKEEELFEVPKIDTAYFIINRSIIDESGNPLAAGYFEFKDPEETENFYLIRNYQYSYSHGTSWNMRTSVDSDKLFNGKKAVQKLFSNVNPKQVFKPDYEKIKLYSLSKCAYEFWRMALLQTQEVANPYAPPPAPIIGNIFNINDPRDYALGNFSASSVSKGEFLLVLR